MKSFRPIILIFLFQYCIFNEAIAQTRANDISVKEISQICLVSPFDCLDNIDNVLLSTSQESRVYFEILQYKLEALFNLKRRELLNQETKKWLNNFDLPPTFQITNAIYYAKSSWELGREKEGREAYLFAKSLLKEVNKEFPSPLRLVLFANLQMQLKEFDEAYQLMLSLAEKYPSSPDIRFMVELHGNLGHASNQLGKTKQALFHWQETKKWVLIFNNKQQIAVVLFNLADIYQQLKQYDEAMKNFLDASKYADEAGDHIKKNQSLYRLLELRLMYESVCQNNTLVSSIEEKYLPKKFIDSFQGLTKQLTSC